MKSALFDGEEQLERASRNAPPLRVGSQGEGVKRVQATLLALGYALPRSFHTNSADGIYGSETSRVVREFQQSRGLAVDGVVGAETIAALDGYLVELRKDPMGRRPGAAFGARGSRS